MTIFRGVFDVLKDVTVFVLFLLTAVLICPVVAVFALWKLFVAGFVSTFYRSWSMEFIGPGEAFICASEGKGDFHENPQTTVLASAIIEGHLGESEFQSNFQKSVLEARNSRGQLIFERVLKKPVRKFGFIFLARAKNFRIENHIRELHISLDDNSVADFLRRETDAPFAPNAPLWSISLIPNYNGQNKTFLLHRFHHIQMDGLSGLQMVKHCCPGSATTPVLPSTVTSEPKRSMTFAQSLASFYGNTIGLPRKFLLERASRTIPPELKTTGGPLIQFPLKIPVQKFKSLKARGIVFTESILTALSYAMSQTNLGKIGLKTTSINLTIPPPALTEAVGNNFMLGIVNIPLGSMTLNRRLQQCRKGLATARSSVSPKLNAAILKFGTLFPYVVFEKLFVQPSDLDAVLISNTPGPAGACRFFDKHLVEDFFISILPTNNHPLFFVAIVMYNGMFNITLTAMSNLFEKETDFSRFVDNFESTLTNLFDSAGEISDSKEV